MIRPGSDREKKVGEVRAPDWVGCRWVIPKVSLEANGLAKDRERMTSAWGRCRDLNRWA